MANLDLRGAVNKKTNGIVSKDELLGKGLLMPFNSVNSGSRKLMFSVHTDQRLPLLNFEIPIVQTGYENQFGEHSSSFIKAETNQTVVFKIDKFSQYPGEHYYLFTIDNNNILRVIERVSYYHISETYGYLFDNEYLDSKNIGSPIKKGDVVQKSTSFNREGNRMDGINLLTTYIAAEYSMEDGIIISESAAKKLESPLLKKVTIVINDNDIPLNLYGDDNNFKAFPDIGEYTKNDLLCVLRREDSENYLYMQSYNRLTTPMISDEKFTVSGKVIDINLYVNNPEILKSSKHYQQINTYYQDYLRFCSGVVSFIDNFRRENQCTLDYNAQKLYSICRDVLSGKQYIEDKVFKNTIIEIYLQENIQMHQGDKMSNRYGGKGVVSKIYPDEFMPKLPNGDTVEVLFNMNTVTNRENPGQLFELSLNFIGRKLIEAMNTGTFDVSECIQMYLTFVSLASPKLGQFMTLYVDSLKTDEEAIFFIQSIIEEGYITLSIDPMEESMDIDKLNRIYQEFPFIKPEYILMPLINSNGKIRYVKSRRPLVVAPEYFYRLKQYAEEKFSVTSLSSTNIRNENSRNKASNMYKAPYAKTPIRFGDMEIGNMMHMGPEIVIENLMIYSSSPHARRLTESMLTDSPFNVNIELDKMSKNRNVEILNAYLKTIGLRLVFRKKPKTYLRPIMKAGVVKQALIKEGLIKKGITKAGIMKQGITKLK